MLKKTFIALSLSLACLSAAHAATLNMDNPEDVLKSDRKIQSSLNDGEESVYYWEGSVYTRIAGERDKHLFKYWGMNIRATKGFNDPIKGYGYRMVSRELLFYLDPKTGEIMRTWKNPWSNETVDIVHIANDPVNMPPQFAKGDRGPAKFRGTMMEDKIMYTYEIPLFYANPLAGDHQVVLFCRR